MKIFSTKMLIFASMMIVTASYATAYTEYGAGTSSCGTWVSDRKTNSAWHQDGQWVNGFISAAGYLGEKLKEVDANAILVFMDNYCQQKPLNKIGDGAKALIIELQSK